MLRRGPCSIVDHHTRFQNFIYKNRYMIFVIHHNGVIMSAMAPQITAVSIVYSAVCSGADHRKHQSSAELALVTVSHRWSVNSHHKRPVTRKIIPFDDVITRFEVMCNRTCAFRRFWCIDQPKTNSSFCSQHMFSWLMFTLGYSRSFRLLLFDLSAVLSVINASVWYRYDNWRFTTGLWVAVFYLNNDNITKQIQNDNNVGKIFTSWALAFNHMNITIYH